jgi:hypothetical protein
MPVWAERIKYLAARINDRDLDGLTEALLARSSNPGPIVAVIGGKGRGKSKLIADISGIEAPAAGVSCAVYGPAWSTLLSKVFRDCRPIRSPSDDQARVLLVEAPALDTVEGESIARTMAREADLILFAVQASQAGTDVEIAFAQDTFADRPCVVVLTKIDQVLPEDRETLLESFLGTLQEAGVHPAAVLTSGFSNNGDDDASESFLRWWKDNGMDMALAAQGETQRRAYRDWLVRANSVVESSIQDVRGRLAPIESTLRASRTAAAALEQYRRIRAALETLPDRAVRRLHSVNPPLPTAMAGAVAPLFDAGATLDEQFRENLQQALQEELAKWIDSAATEVHNSLKPEVGLLENQAREFAGEVRHLVQQATGKNPGISFGAGFSGQSGVHPPVSMVTVPDFPAEDLAQQLLTKLTGGAFGAGAALGLIGGLPIFGVLLSVLMAVRQLTTVKQMQTAAKLRFQGTMQAHAVRAGQDAMLQLDEEMRDVWLRYTVSFDESIKPYERYLMGEIEQREEWRDASQKSLYQQLAQEEQRLLGIRGDLARLGDLSQSGEVTIGGHDY